MLDSGLNNWHSRAIIARKFTMPRTKLPIILASGSKWRKRLLKRHGIKVKTHASAFDEVRKHISPRKVAILNACGKAREVSSFYKRGVIIGVDTIGIFRGKILGKPKNRNEAKKMLTLILGKTHRVISGLCILHIASGKKYITAVTTKVTFRKISEQELENYLDSKEWKGKAGSYAIQGRAKKFVKKIEGDITNVVGLPIGKLKKILKEIPFGI